jgi:hypothetical protein
MHMHSDGGMAWDFLGVGEAALSKREGVLLRRELAGEAPRRRMAYRPQDDV